LYRDVKIKAVVIPPKRRKGLREREVRNCLGADLTLSAKLVTIESDLLKAKIVLMPETISDKTGNEIATSPRVKPANSKVMLGSRGKISKAVRFLLF
jgi:hypothetical protein